MGRKLSKTAVSAWARLVRAQQSALRAVEADLKAAGLPPLAWYDVLLELERAPKRELRNREIQRHMLLERYSVSRLVDRLEGEGLVSREPCDEDARGAAVRLTAAGARLRQRMWPAYEAAIARHFAQKFSGDELESLALLLERLK